MMYDATPKKRSLEEPTSYLRWLMSKPSFDMGYPPVIPRLQQKWHISEYDERGYGPIRVYYEWRDVEYVMDKPDNELDASINRETVKELDQ